MTIIGPQKGSDGPIVVEQASLGSVSEKYHSMQIIAHLLTFRHFKIQIFMVSLHTPANATIKRGLTFNHTHQHHHHQKQFTHN